jgi:hypothetical protein
LSQTPLAAGNLTIAGALASGGIVTIPTAQHVTIDCAGSDAARSFIVNGTDDADNILTETLAGSSASTTTSTKNFKTITSISVDDATAGAVTAGIVSTFETRWFPINHHISPVSYAYQVVIGTATFTVEGTLDNVFDNSITPVVTTTPVQASGSSSVSGVSIIPVVAIRVKVTAYTSGTITLRLLQAGVD